MAVAALVVAASAVLAVGAVGEDGERGGAEEGREEVQGNEVDTVAPAAGVEGIVVVGVAIVVAGVGGKATGQNGNQKVCHTFYQSFHSPSSFSSSSLYNHPCSLEVYALAADSAHPCSPAVYARAACSLGWTL